MDPEKNKVEPLEVSLEDLRARFIEEYSQERNLASSVLKDVLAQYDNLLIQNGFLKVDERS